MQKSRGKGEQSYQHNSSVLQLQCLFSVAQVSDINVNDINCALPLSLPPLFL